MPYKNPEDRRRRFKERYATDPEFRARHNAAAEDWAARNPERIAAAQQRYNEANRALLNEKARNRDPGAKRAASKRHREANREAVRQQDRESKQRRRASNDPVLRAHIRADRFRRRGGSKPTAAAREYFAVIAGDPCSYCGGPANTVDHIDPLRHGGAGEWDNFTAACASCNTRKNDSPLLLAAAERSLFRTTAANLT